MPMDAERLAARHAERRVRVVEKLLPVVEELLDGRRSYLDVSVEEIIEMGGMARSTFYRYFDDKSDLLMALSESAMQEILGAMEAMWELEPDATREDFAGAVRRIVYTWLPHTKLMNAMTEASTYDPAVAERYDDLFGTARAATARHIREGQKAGYIRADLDPREAAGWLTWMGERGMQRMVWRAGRSELKRLEASLATIIWATLYEGTR